jgi:hypothetical protein
MPTYDTYGFADKDIQTISEVISNTLGITWKLHDSLYKGEYYLAGKIEQENLELGFNYVAGIDDWKESESKEYPVLLYVNKSQRWQEIEKFLLGAFNEKISLLRRTHFD